MKNSEKYWVVADQALFSGLSFLVTIWIARNTSTASFGMYSAWVLGIYLIISAIGAWTIQPFQIRYQENQGEAGYLSFVFWFQGLWTGIALVVMGCLAWLTELVNFDHMVIYATGFVFNDFFRKVLLAMNRIRLAFMINAATALISVTALFILEISHTFSLEHALQVLSFAYGFVFLLALWHLKPFQWEGLSFQSHLKYHKDQGKWFFMTAVSQWWAGNLYVVASGLVLGKAALGALRLGQSLFGILNVLLQAFENYALPQTAREMKINVSQGVSYIKNLSIKAAWLFIPMLLLIFVFAESLLILAGGDQYAGYGQVLQGLCILYVFIYLSQPIRCIIRALEWNQYFFKGYILTLVFALIFSRQLLIQFGLNGVLTGLIISQIILIGYWSLNLYQKNKEVWKSFISF
ncbi:MAG TPA: oligosaccharide flippase family protein [Saprospiraceae bacterium]|nr:oligosaccharide flippase family protein [Saprospiraceae bacterium]